MHRIDGPGATIDNRFTEGNPATAVPATTVTDDWLNDMQEELITLLTEAGIAPVKGTQNQILAALRTHGLTPQGSYWDVFTYAANQALGVAQLGAWVLPTANSITFTLPPLSSIEIGHSVRFYGNTKTGITIQRAGADNIIGGTGIGTITSLALGMDDTVEFVKVNSSSWHILGGDAHLAGSSAFGRNLSASGYQKLPGGLIIQWGTFVSSPTADVAVTFPIAFPTALARLVVTCQSSGSGAWGSYNTTTVNGFNGNAWAASGARQSGGTCSYIAVGY